MLEQAIGCFTCDPRDLVDMIDVRVQAHLFGHVSAFIGKFDESIGPRIRFISDAARGHSQTLGSETDALDVRNTE